MSRIEDEYILYVGRNRSGQDSGQIDYGIRINRFEDLSTSDLEDMIKTLNVLISKTNERLLHLCGINEELEEKVLAAVKLSEANFGTPKDMHVPFYGQILKEGKITAKGEIYIKYLESEGELETVRYLKEINDETQNGERNRSGKS